MIVITGNDLCIEYTFLIKLNISFSFINILNVWGFGIELNFFKKKKAFEMSINIIRIYVHPYSYIYLCKTFYFTTNDYQMVYYTFIPLICVCVCV